ncbi:MAG: YkgJ family cysteine cluster protein [Pirellulaceae bacterium]|nr:YkgJ family cysteine cluster protein [Planctomycetaceae bacterium]
MSTSITPGKPRRKDLPKDANLCEFCSAKCCKYFALPIDEPDEPTDFDYIRWYLLHDRASVFVEDDDWYLLVHTDCKHLKPDNMCGIYETRPQICREYLTDNCEYEDHWTYDRYFETPEQVVEYYEAVVSEGAATIRSAKPDLLTVVS